jgi:hypothetical protein
MLEINKAILIENGTVKSQGYRYRLDRANNELIFLYDNTLHSSIVRAIVSECIKPAKTDIMSARRQCGSVHT